MDVKELEKLAQNGDADAQNEFGIRLAEGDGVTQNYEKRCLG